MKLVESKFCESGSIANRLLREDGMNTYTCKRIENIVNFYNSEYVRTEKIDIPHPHMEVWKGDISVHNYCDMIDRYRNEDERKYLVRTEKEFQRIAPFFCLARTLSKDSITRIIRK